MFRATALVKLWFCTTTTVATTTTAVGIGRWFAAAWLQDWSGIGINLNATDPPGDRLLGVDFLGFVASLCGRQQQWLFCCNILRGAVCAVRGGVLLRFVANALVSFGTSFLSHFLYSILLC